MAIIFRYQRVVVQDVEVVVKDLDEQTKLLSKLMERKPNEILVSSDLTIDGEHVNHSSYCLEIEEAVQTHRRINSLVSKKKAKG